MSEDGDVAARGSRDWRVWHESYADADSSLSRRLMVVRGRIGEVLDATEGPIRVLSLCAGDGRDILSELAARPSVCSTTTLVELDPELAAAARQAGSQLDGVEVRQGDAGVTALYEDVLPVDLLLLCGIFGNIPVDDIMATVAAVPSMLAPDGAVIWTRGRFGDEEDLRPAIREWFVETGLREVAFDGDPETFGVGVARAGGAPPTAAPLPDRLFRFGR